jgi:hypothetical protein
MQGFRLIVAGTLGCCLAGPGTRDAMAQATRQQAIRAERAEKAAKLEPRRRGRVEALLFKVEDGLLVERIFNPPNGFFPKLGGFTEGSGFGAGLAYRRSNPYAMFTVSGAASTRGYAIAEGAFRLPRIGRDGFLDLSVRRRDYPQEDFFGLGPDSRREDRTTFALRETSLSLTGGVRLGRRRQPTFKGYTLTAGGQVEYASPRVGSGTDPRFPSIEQVFDPSALTGFTAQPDFLRYEGHVDFDYQWPQRNPRRGGRYQVAFGRQVDRDYERYSFNRVEIDVRQAIPFLHEHRLIVLRGVVSHTSPDRGHEVPFYARRTLGGAYTHRGFVAYRFRDTDLLLLNAEYRYQVNPLLMGALFVDAGKVAARLEDLDFRDLETAYGFGLRVGAMAGVFVRLDVALGGGEGARYLLRFNDVF